MSILTGGVSAGGLAQFNGAETFAQESIRLAAENRHGREVWPAATEKPEAPQTILRYATQEELDHVRSFGEKIKVASAEVARIDSVLCATILKLDHLKFGARDRNAELAARALGDEAKQLPSTTVQSLSDLEATRVGLATRLAEAQSTADNMTGRRRAVFLTLIKDCGERAKDEYRRLAVEIGEVHLLLSTAQARLRPGELIPDLYWGKLFIPGFDFRPEHTEYGIPRITSGFDNGHKMPKAQDALRRQTEELFGARIV